MHILEQPRTCEVCGRETTTRSYSGIPECARCRQTYINAYRRARAFGNRPMEPRWQAIYTPVRRLVTRVTRRVLSQVLA